MRNIHKDTHTISISLGGSRTVTSNTTVTIIPGKVAILYTHLHPTVVTNRAKANARL